MPKYCHTCFCEFNAEIEVCPKDKTKLSLQEPNMALSSIFVDFYAVANRFEAEKIVFLLEDNGIEARQNKFSISQIPVISDTDYAISVKKEELHRAVGIIEEAQKNNIISNYGRFIDL